jgi:D-3-phosphoglycerate dehydrogenase
MKALVLAPFSESSLASLEKVSHVTHESWTETRRIWEPQELGGRLNREGIDILIVEADFIFSEVFENAPNLKFAGLCRGTVNHVDLDAATENGVVVVNTPGRNAQAVAEMTFALMLSMTRQIPLLDCYVKRGQWRDPVDAYINYRGVELNGGALGIIGLGAVGRKVARLGRAFGMRVLAYDPFVGSIGKQKHGAHLVDLKELLSESRFVTLHAASTKGTIGMLGHGAFELMRRGSYLINTASYDLVDEKPLVDALTSGRLAGAAFDVHESHPITPISPLFKLENVILTPHVSGATDGTVERHSAMIVEDLERFLSGLRPRRLANPKVWRRHGR